MFVTAGFVVDVMLMAYNELELVFDLVVYLKMKVYFFR